jgi:Ni/Fe-hydrogenase subunit HybB-like protein
MPEHLLHFQYLLFGLGDSAKLVPWFWTAFVLLLLAIVILVNPATRKNGTLSIIAFCAVFVAIWIDKGLGLVIPGFIPSQTGEVFEYFPSMPEVLITISVWAIGGVVLTLLYKIAISVKQAN